jgi:transcriptional regulator with XRE-family HTH domain
MDSAHVQTAARRRRADGTLPTVLRGERVRRDSAGVAGRAHRSRTRIARRGSAQTEEHLGAVLPAWRQDPRRAGRRLRMVREVARLTQLGLAAASGVTHETICQLELGRRAPQATSLRKLARALQVAPALFVSQEEIEGPGWTVAQTATWLDVPAPRISRWLRLGELTGIKISGEWRVSVAKVMALEASGRLRGRSRRLDPRYRG